MLNKVWSDRIPTLCVSVINIFYQMTINEEFFMTRPPNIREGATQHELLHIINYHLTEFRDLSAIDPKLANWAMDIEINQYIPDENREDGWLMPSTFPHLELELKNGTRYYFNELLKARKAQDKDIQAILDALEQGENECTLPSTGKKVEIHEHDWSEFESLDEATQQIIQQQAEYVVRTVADQIKKSHGTVPGEISEILERLDVLQKPKFDWRGFVRRFIGRSSEIYTKKSRMKLNKRHVEQPGLRIKRHKHALVAWDTSASFSTEELVESQNEVAHIERTGTKITMIQADTNIQYVGPFDSRKPVEVHGRGGTSFQPVVDYYEANRSKYSCLIYFTDGEAETPQVNSASDILWVLSSKSNMNEDLPGITIQLEL